MPPERSGSSFLSLHSQGGRSSRGSGTTNFSQTEQENLDHIRREKAVLLQEIKTLKDEIADCDWIIERLDVDEDGKPNSERQTLLVGKKRFNLDPKKGIEYLVEQKILQRTPEDVAKFLMCGEGLVKTAIGDYLGEPDAFHQKVRRLQFALSRADCLARTANFQLAIFTTLIESLYGSTSHFDSD